MFKLTLFVTQLRTQGQTDLRAANVLQLVLIVLYAAKLANNLSQHIFLARADDRYVSRNQMMDREDIRHLDIQRRLCTSIEVIELVDVELSLGGGNIDHFSTD